MSVRLFTMKISQWAFENFCGYRKMTCDHIFPSYIAWSDRSQLRAKQIINFTGFKVVICTCVMQPFSELLFGSLQALLSSSAFADIHNVLTVSSECDRTPNRGPQLSCSPKLFLVTISLYSFQYFVSFRWWNKETRQCDFRFLHYYIILFWRRTFQKTKMRIAIIAIPYISPNSSLLVSKK